MIKEACVETYEEAVNAEKRGANRIELCSDLATGGLTPSHDLMEKTCTALKIPVMVMIRPRPGNFVYNDTEVQLMKTEIDAAKKAGAAGVVFGLLTNDNNIDKKNTQLLTEYAYPFPVTFHKAVDEMQNPADGIKILQEIKGIKRILTSGGKPTALEGLECLTNMLQTAAGKPIIIVAGKVTDKNVEKIQKLTGAAEFHGRQIVGNLER